MLDASTKFNTPGSMLFRGRGGKMKGRRDTATPSAFSYGPVAQLVCWIADSIHLPPRWRTKVQTSVTSTG
jgi:hypothetical protein